MARTVIFYGYPSSPASVGEDINAAIIDLKLALQIRSADVQFRPWPETRISGKRLAATIHQNIGRGHVFACDLTYPNRNVAFELGYAIGSFKRLWISLNTSIAHADRNYQKLFFNLIGTGYAKYINHRELAAAFELDRPWATLDQTILPDRYRSQRARPELPTLLHIRPALDVEAVVSIHETLGRSIFGEGLLVDDPKENPSPSLDWYADKLVTADAVLVQLLSEEQVGHEDHNIKASLLAGLARGLKRPVRMVGQAPLESPVDYGELLKVHDTTGDAIVAVEQWLSVIASNLPRRRPRRPREEEKPPERIDLRQISLGDPVAEHERFDLDNYFIETSSYYRALAGPTTILVGRRGTGKTAILYAIQAEASGDTRNHVTVIKPVGYEIDGLVRVLDSVVESSERGYLVASLWKFLIYTELANSVWQSLVRRPVYLQMTADETTFVEYCENNQALISMPFSERIDRAVRSLKGVANFDDALEQRTKISEALHANLLVDLRQMLGLVLSQKRRVLILIDNLDEPWRPGPHLNRLAELLAGLLTLAQDLPAELGREDSWRRPVNATVTVLLRSDILAFIQPFTVEQDKLPIEQVLWNDRAQLLRVLDERLVYKLASKYTAENVWEAIFPSDVVGKSSPDFILDNVLPRPRDVIYLTREAMALAVNRGHDTVEPDDLIAAREKYSEYVFRSILKEDDPEKGKLEDVLFEFAGAVPRAARSDVEARMEDAGVDVGDREFYVDLLCDIGFLAVETAEGYAYTKNESERQMMRRVGQQLAKQRGEEEHFQISSAFHHVLGVR